MKVVFTFGRFNPPTIGHEKLIKKVESVAGSGADFLIYPSWSQSPDKDPMPHEVKVKYMKLAFRKYADKIISDPKCKTAIHVVTKLYDAGYTDVTMVVGGDRVSDFNKLINKYNGVKSKHGFYEFDNGVKVVSAGERDPDATGVEGMSASKMRKAAAEGDLESFKTGIPAVMPDKMKKQMFDDLRKHMVVQEYERDYKDEYAKFQSSPERIKYRAELNKYNREKGTYGNGDGKDASHKKGKIVGFEDQSKNRGRREKSRLKGYKQNVAKRAKRKKVAEVHEIGTDEYRRYMQLLTPEEDVLEFPSERALTDAEKKVKERMVMNFKKNAAQFKKKYGAKWKEVMYATATKQAKNEEHMKFSNFRKM